MKKTIIGKLFVAIIFWMLGSCAPTVVEKDRASARLHYDIAVASLQEGDLRIALRELLSAIDQDPNLAVAHNALGLVFHQMGRMEDALQHYQKAIRINTKFSECYNNMGALLIDLERYDEAIDSLKNALRDILYTTPSWAEGNLGWAYYKNGDLEKGRRHLRNAVATNPKFCRGYSWLAQLELAQSNLDQVIAYCKRFQKHCLEDPALQAKIPPYFTQELEYYLGRAYQGKGDRSQAREVFQRCVKLSNTDLTIKCQRHIHELD